jgi:hypothetical protein
VVLKKDHLFLFGWLFCKNCRQGEKFIPTQRSEVREALPGRQKTGGSEKGSPFFIWLAYFARIPGRVRSLSRHSAAKFGKPCRGDKKKVVLKKDHLLYLAGLFCKNSRQGEKFIPAQRSEVREALPGRLGLQT